MRRAPYLTCITFACMCCAAVVNSQPPTYRPHTPNAAYGLAVVSVMLLDTSLLALVMITAWQVGCFCDALHSHHTFPVAEPCPASPLHALPVVAVPQQSQSPARRPPDTALALLRVCSGTLGRLRPSGWCSRLKRAPSSPAMVGGLGRKSIIRVARLPHWGVYMRWLAMVLLHAADLFLPCSPMGAVQKVPEGAWLSLTIATVLACISYGECHCGAASIHLIVFSFLVTP